jgi:hypothetical protein
MPRNLEVAADADLQVSLHEFHFLQEGVGGLAGDTRLVLGVGRHFADGHAGAEPLDLVAQDIVVVLIGGELGEVRAVDRTGDDGGAGSLVLVHRPFAGDGRGGAALRQHAEEGIFVGIDKRHEVREIALAEG